MGGEGPVGAPRSSGRLSADLSLLLHDESGRPAQPLLEALLDKRSDGDSSAIRDAADRLLRRHAPGAVDLAPAAVALLQAAGDERSQRLFVAGCLQRDGRSQAQLGEREGVSATASARSSRVPGNGSAPPWRPRPGRCPGQCARSADRREG